MQHLFLLMYISLLHISVVNSQYQLRINFSKMFAICVIFSRVEMLIIKCYFIYIFIQSSLKFIKNVFSKILDPAERRLLHLLPICVYIWNMWRADLLLGSDHEITGSHGNESARNNRGTFGNFVSYAVGAEIL
jgi:hypothetical protein